MDRTDYHRLDMERDATRIRENAHEGPAMPTRSLYEYYDELSFSSLSGSGHNRIMVPAESLEEDNMSFFDESDQLGEFGEWEGPRYYDPLTPGYQPPPKPPLCPYDLSCFASQISHSPPSASGFGHNHESHSPTRTASSYYRNHKPDYPDTSPVQPKARSGDLSPRSFQGRENHQVLYRQRVVDDLLPPGLLPGAGTALYEPHGISLHNESGVYPIPHTRIAPTSHEHNLHASTTYTPPHITRKRSREDLEEGKDIEEEQEEAQQSAKKYRRGSLERKSHRIKSGVETRTSLENKSVEREEAGDESIQEQGPSDLSRSKNYSRPPVSILKPPRHYQRPGPSPKKRERFVLDIVNQEDKNEDNPDVNREEKNDTLTTAFQPNGSRIKCKWGGCLSHFEPQIFAFEQHWDLCHRAVENTNCYVRCSWENCEDMIQVKRHGQHVLNKHTGIIRHLCETCQKTFARPDLLRRHWYSTKNSCRKPKERVKIYYCIPG